MALFSGAYFALNVPQPRAMEKYSAYRVCLYPSPVQNLLTPRLRIRGREYRLGRYCRVVPRANPARVLQPFLTPVPPLTSNNLTTLAAPLAYALGAVRFVLVLVLVLVHVVLVDGLCLVFVSAFSILCRMPLTRP